MYRDPVMDALAELLRRDIRRSREFAQPVEQFLLDEDDDDTPPPDVDRRVVTYEDV